MIKTVANKCILSINDMPLGLARDPSLDSKHLGLLILGHVLQGLTIDTGHKSFYLFQSNLYT